ncbi:MAG: tRNA pseudouridine(38-40) synthase TruA [Acidimicrobiales bacterium]
MFDREPEPPAPGAAPTFGARVRLTVAYDGGGFRGFAVNPGVRTVGGTLAEALSRVLGHPVRLVCAGRTDAGVHAWGQVVHFDSQAAEPDLVTLQRSVNSMLGPAVVIRSAVLAPAGFDARRDATGRVYRYSVLNRPVADPFLAATTWHVEDALDLGSMQLACDPLIGQHDWSSFCRRPPEPGASLVRVVRRAGWTMVEPGLLRFEIEASSFCHQMVRAVVGLLVAVGRGRVTAGEVVGIIGARDRAGVPSPAPPHGLCLWNVSYP